MNPPYFRPPSKRYSLVTGVGGIGTGMFFELEGNQTLGRNESRLGKLLDVRDFCKLHIILHYVAVLTGGGRSSQAPRILPVGKVGDDDRGRSLVEDMRRVGMDTRFVETSPVDPTLLSACFQYPDGSGGNVTASNGAASRLSPEDVDRIEPILAEHSGRFMGLAAPEVPLPARQRLLELADKHGGTKIGAFSSAEIEQARRMKMLPLLDIISMNEDEAATLAGAPWDADGPAPALDAVASVLLEANPQMRIVITAGPAGAYACAGGAWCHCPAVQVPVKSTAGAGDALLAGVMIGEILGLPLVGRRKTRKKPTDGPLDDGLALAVMLACASCTSEHTIHPELDLAMLIELAGRFAKSFSKRITDCFGDNGG